MVDWQRIWNDDAAMGRFSPTRAILYLFSLLYRPAIHLRNFLYDHQILTSAKLSCPVISIGNITVGGTGKTPCVVMLAKILQWHGFRPAVISRGYGAAKPKPVNIVSDGKTVLLDSEAAGDEPLLMARALPGVPVITGAKRRQTGQAAIDHFGANVLICDDAFQHRQLFRDVDIVLLDSASPLGNGHLLPRGELREPLESLKRAGCFILTRAVETQPVHPDVARIARTSGIPVFRATHRFKEISKGDESQRLPPGELRGKKICAFCGIARPESFKNSLIAAEAKILSFIEFPDHYAYDRHDLEALNNQFKNLRADYWLTTEKDAMRLVNHSEFLKMICVLRMEMEIIPSRQLFENFIVEWLAAVVPKGKT